MQVDLVDPRRQSVEGGQDVAVGFALLPSTAPDRWEANACLWLAVVLTLVTGAQYMLDGRRLGVLGTGDRVTRAV